MNKAASTGVCCLEANTFNDRGDGVGPAKVVSQVSHEESAERIPGL